MTLAYIDMNQIHFIIAEKNNEIKIQLLYDSSMFNSCYNILPETWTEYNTYIIWNHSRAIE